MSQRQHGEYVIDDDRSRQDWARVHSWLSSSYWSPGIARDQVERAAQHSALVVGVFLGTEQVGYLRVISDKTRLAYLCDVWIDNAHRRKGLARAMVRYAMDHPDFRTAAWMLATADAHGVYAPLGFQIIREPQRYMRCEPREPTHLPGSPS